MIISLIIFFIGYWYFEPNIDKVNNMYLLYYNTRKDGSLNRNYIIIWE